MEKKEKDRIIKYLVELIANTDCNTLVITELYSKGFISIIEKQCLEAEKIKTSRAAQLYDILPTRKGAYQVILQILQNNCQSEACDILKKCCDEESFISYCDLIFDEEAKLNDKSNIYKGKFGSRSVAVKELSRNDFPADAAVNVVNILTRVDNHENILRYFTTVITAECVKFIVEQCDCSLDKFIKSEHNSATKLSILQQVTSGLNHLHCQNIVNLYIHPENILLVLESQGQYRAKISNFRFARETQNGTTTIELSLNRFGKIGWRPKEILDKFTDKESEDTILSINVTPAADIFSLGCIFFYVLTSGSHPFGSLHRRDGNILDDKTVFKGLKNDKLKIQVHQKSEKLIQKMVHKDHKSRPTTTQILNKYLCESKDHSFCLLEATKIDKICVDTLYHT